MLLNRIMELANGLNSALRLRRLSSECPLLGGRTLWPICPSSISARPPRAAELPALTLPRPVSWPITRYNKTITNCIEFVLTHLCSHSRAHRCAISYKKITRRSFGTTNSRCRSLTVTTNGSDSTTSAVSVQKCVQLA